MTDIIQNPRRFNTLKQLLLHFDVCSMPTMTAMSRASVMNFLQNARGHRA